jgi:hypothetical protein
MEHLFFRFGDGFCFEAEEISLGSFLLDRPLFNKGVPFLAPWALS